jgi:hypothetical protein
MGCKEIEAKTAALEEALNCFEWDKAEEICNTLKDTFYTETEPCSPDQSVPILKSLARKRRFILMKGMAEAMMVCGIRTPTIRRLYAQALIEHGEFIEAEYLLQSILDEQPGNASERGEARGLLGRLFKQLYMNPGASVRAQYTPNFQRALKEYWQGYSESKQTSYWHGINVIALLMHAKRHGLPVENYPSTASIAQRLLDILKPKSPNQPRAAWELATEMEALIALDRYDEAFKTAEIYVSSNGADAFELGSTERQLTEVWQLDENPRSKAILTLLRSQLLQKEGGHLKLSLQAAQQDAQAVDQLTQDQGLEALLGSEKTKTLLWYKLGLTRCDSIARIENRVGKAIGTGWIVKGEDLSSKWAGQRVLITAKHVISPPVDGLPYQPTLTTRALLPGDAVAHFHTSGARERVKDTLWTSPDLRVDTTVVTLENTPTTAEPLEIRDSPETLPAPPEHVYIIGHPAGRELEFSLSDNGIIECAPHLHSLPGTN